MINIQKSTYLINITWWDQKYVYIHETITTIYAINIPITTKSVLSPSLFIIICVCDKNI